MIVSCVHVALVTSTVVVFSSQTDMIGIYLKMMHLPRIASIQGYGMFNEAGLETIPSIQKGAKKILSLASLLQLLASL